MCLCLFVCVCVVGGSIAKWLGHLPSDPQVQFPVMPLWCCFVEQETLLTLLQSTQLLKGAWCQLGKQKQPTHGQL